MRITMAHGNGGRETADLIGRVFMRHFGNEYNSPMADSAILETSGRLAFTTDSFVVAPLFFPGGDIGRLSVCGTVNDLLTTGAKPLYLSAGFIMMEGLPLDELDAICQSMAMAAAESGVHIVTGDTKVVEGNGGLYINTAGIGSIRGKPVSFSDAREGDAIIVTGNLGDHHACIMSRRMGIENDIQSDVAPLNGIVDMLCSEQIPIHGMRDITRGGLGTVLHEVAATTGLAPVIQEADIPVNDGVSSFAKIMGLDPLYMSNEGKAVIIVPSDYREKALAAIRSVDRGIDSACSGFLEKGKGPILKTRIGGIRNIGPMHGEHLPRIC